MTPDERLRLGQAADRLLTDETFGDACRVVDGWYRDQVFRTKPTEAEKREELYAEYSGFRRVLERLSTWRSDAMKVADEIERS